MSDFGFIPATGQDYGDYFDGGEDARAHEDYLRARDRAGEAIEPWYTAAQLRSVPEGGLFRYSPGGPLWRRYGVIVHSSADPGHAIAMPNWDATVYVEGNGNEG